VIGPFGLRGSATTPATPPANSSSGTSVRSSSDRVELPGAPHSPVQERRGPVRRRDVGGDDAETPSSPGDDKRARSWRSAWTPGSTSGKLLARQRDAGIDPASPAPSGGSAVWSENVVDGAPAPVRRGGNCPRGGPYGLFAIGTTGPTSFPARSTGTPAGENGTAPSSGTPWLPAQQCAWRDYTYGFSRGVRARRLAGSSRPGGEKYTGYPRRSFPEGHDGRHVGSVRYCTGPCAPSGPATG